MTQAVPRARALCLAAALVTGSGCVAEMGTGAVDGSDGPWTSTARCGDGLCDSAESCARCAADCGACSTTCGNGRCDSAESCTSCAADCGACPATCGNGRCDATETCGSCPSDCSCASCSPANYVKIKNTEPLPADYCPYTELPFRTGVPENPQNIESENTQILRDYYIASPGTNEARVMGTIGKMPDAVGDGACDASITYCDGSSGYPVWITSETDPLVTIDCATTVYGCSDALQGNTLVTSMPAFHIPANYRPSSGPNGGDRNGEVIQPSGDAVLIYGCWPSRDFQDGDVLATGYGPCSYLAGAHYTNIMTANGTNPGTVDGGDDYAALPARYSEVMSGQIHHALYTWIGTCTEGAVYPGTGAGGVCSYPKGLPSGVHMWLSSTHAEIDAMIASGTQPDAMRPFLYAMHDYGMYAMDGFWAAGLGQPGLEELTAVVINGADNPWADWFIANGGGLSADGIYKHTNVIDWQAVKDSMYVVSPCYAEGSCSDSLPPGSRAAP